MAKYKAPSKIFRIFPSATEDRIKLVINTVKHETSQMLLGFLMNRSWEKEPTAHEWNWRLKSLTGCDFGDLRPLFEAMYANNFLDIYRLHEDSRIHYTLTGPAYQYGVTAAHFTLMYSVDNNMPMADVFGPHPATDTPTTFRRYKMLKELYESQHTPLKKSNLIHDLFATYNQITEDLLDLGALEMVDSKALDVQETGHSAFLWQGDTENLSSNLSNTTASVARTLAKRKKASAGDLANATGLRYVTVIKAISVLSRHKIIRPVGAYSMSKKYEITISPQGKKFWETYITPLHNFLAHKQDLPRFNNIQEAKPYIAKALDFYKLRQN